MLIPKKVALKIGAIFAFFAFTIISAVLLGDQASSNKISEVSKQLASLEESVNAGDLTNDEKALLDKIKEDLGQIETASSDQYLQTDSRIGELQVKVQEIESSGASDGVDGKDGVDGTMTGSAVTSINSLTNSIVINGTTNQISVSSDLGSIITLALPQSIGTMSDPAFRHLVLSGNLTSSGSLTFGTKITGTCEGLTNFVWVPGSAKYGTLPGFCVAQYEAKNNGSDVPVSTPTGTPWGNITQRDARLKSRDACDGCHLISEAEWMTIAENVAFVDANWSGGSVGSGCVFRGNVGSDDACGYDGDDPESGTGRDGKASLTLSTGEEIWDLSGNVLDMTDQYMIGEEGPVDDTPATEDLEYTNITKFGDFNYMQPPDDSWDSSNGIGRLYTVYSSTTRRVISRGGIWGHGAMAGIYGVYLMPQTNSDLDPHMGFRVAK